MYDIFVHGMYDILRMYICIFTLYGCIYFLLRDSYFKKNMIHAIFFLDLRERIIIHICFGVHT